MDGEGSQPAGCRKAPLKHYLESIAAYRPLTRSREREVARRAREGSRKAMDRLVGAQLRFVVGMARRFRAPGLDLLDLIAEGSVGVEKAARNYDERRDGRFLPLALSSARREMRRAVSEGETRRWKDCSEARSGACGTPPA